MKLNLLERLIALQLLPEKANYADLRVVHNAKMKLAPSEAEAKEFEIRQITVIPKEDFDKLLESNKGNEDAVRKSFAGAYKQEEVGTVQTAWNQKGKEDKEVELSERAKEIVRSKLKEMDKKNELEEKHMTICEKFNVFEESK